MVQKERHQMKFLEYLKTISLRGEFRMYVMDHEMAVWHAITNAHKVPSTVKDEYVITTSGYRVKNIKLRQPIYDAAYKYYLANR